MCIVVNNMKYLIILFAALFIGLISQLPAHAVWGHTQNASTEIVAGSVVVTFGSNVTAGDLITVCASAQASETVTSITDGGSNTYIPILTETVNGGTISNYTYYAIATTGGFTTVTVNYSGSTGEASAMADEWSFTKGNISIVGSSSNNNISGSINTTSGNVSWANGPVLLWNAVGSNSVAVTGFTAGSGCTLYGSKTGSAIPLFSQALLNDPTPNSPTNIAGTMNVSHSWASIGVAFQSSGDVYSNNAAMLLGQP
jgi:hypothetical protein